MMQTPDNAGGNQLEEALGDIEQRLAEDTTGEVAKELVRYFREAATNVSAALKQPANPEQFKILQSLSEALDASQRVVKTIWETQHEKQLSV
jgi:hypothetical protein